MPKRPNPAASPATDSKKRPRTDGQDNANDGNASASSLAPQKGVGSGAALNVARPASSTSTSTSRSRAASKQKSPVAASGKVTSSVTNGSSNSFLRNQREAKRSTAATNGGTKMNDATIDDDEPRDDTTTTEIDNKTNSSTKGDNNIKRNLWGMALAAVLCVTNALSASCVVYFLSQQSLHRVSQMRCVLEVDKLKEELTRNKDVISVLRSGMDASQRRIDFIEQAQDAKKRGRQRQDRDSSGEGEKGISEENRIEWSQQEDLIELENAKLLEDMKRRLAEFE